MTLPRARRSWGAPVSCALALLLVGAPPAMARARHAARRGVRRESVAGVVTDGSGAPLQGARVLIAELERAVYTDSEGRFVVSDVPPGRYTLEVRNTGYRTSVIEAEVPTEGPLRITLTTAPIPLAPLTVTAARAPLAPGRSPLPVSVLGETELDRDISVSLAHTLERLPGMRTLSTGREIGKPVIRGLTGSRVLVLSDGLRVEDYAWSDEDGPAMDAAMAERVEVVRGPASVLYGADAVGGVVNVVSRALPDANGGEGFTDGEAEVALATNNREADVVVRGEGARGAWGWRATAAGRLAEALHTPEGELENTGFGSFNGEVAAVRRGPWGSFTLRYVHNGGEFKLLEEEGPPPGVEEGMEKGPERRLGDDRVQLLGNFPLGSARLETRLQGQRHNIVELEDDPEALARGEFIEVPVFDLTLTTGLAEGLLHHSLASGTSGTVGFTGKLQESSTDGVIPIVPGADQRAVGGFLLERLEKGPWSLLAGLRTDLTRLDASGDSPRAFGATTWSVGANLDLADALDLKASVGTAWRAPTLFELYASGPRLGEARYEIGRADLNEERSVNVDVGLQWAGAGVRAEVSAFRNDFDGFLYIQPTDEILDGYAVYRYSQADAVLRGGEASVDVEATPWLTVSARGDYVRGTNVTRDEPLPLMPPRRFVFGADVHGDRVGDWAWLGAEVEHVAEPDRVNPLDISVGEYTLVHFSAGVRGRVLGRAASMDLRVRNAGNVSYRDFLSRYKAFALDPGRDIGLRVRMEM
jgi:iron complex outermembrane receptor protein